MKKKPNTPTVKSAKKPKVTSHAAIIDNAPSIPATTKKARRSAAQATETTVVPAVAAPVIPRGSSKKTATRYTPEEKAEIVAFARDYDSAKGRGGKSAAVKKYGVSAISLSKWMDASPADGKEKQDRPDPAIVPKPVKTAKTSRLDGSKVSDIEATLTRMMKIQDLIGDLQAEFDDLKETL